MFSIFCAIENMKFSSIVIVREKRRPWPLSHVSVTGVCGVNVSPSAFHTVSASGTGTLAEAGAVQPNSVKYALGAPTGAKSAISGLLGSTVS